MKRILTLTITAALVLAALTGCSSAADTAAEPGRATNQSYEAADYTPAAGYDSDYGYDDYAAEAEAWSWSDADAGWTDGADRSVGAAIPTFLDPDNEDGIRLVYTVDMTLQTVAFPQGTRKLLETVEQVCGFVRSTHVEGRSLYTPDAPRAARYTLSIPTVELAGFLVEMEDAFNLVRLDQESRDITRRYAAGTGNLDDLRTREAELEALLERLYEEEDFERAAEIEEMLYDIRRQASSQSASVGGMDIDLRYSTVTVQLYEVVGLEELFADEEARPFAARFGEAAGDSLASFLGMLQSFLLWLTSIWPALVVLAALVALALLVRRLVRDTALGRRLRARRPDPAEPPPAPIPPAEQDGTEQ